MKLRDACGHETFQFTTTAINPEKPGKFSACFVCAELLELCLLPQLQKIRTRQTKPIRDRVGGMTMQSQGNRYSLEVVGKTRIRRELLHTAN